MKIAVYHRIDQHNQAVAAEQHLTLVQWARVREAAGDSIAWYIDDLTQPGSTIDSSIRFHNDTVSGAVQVAVVYSLERLDKGYASLRDWLTRLHEQGVRVVSVGDDLDTERDPHFLKWVNAMQKVAALRGRRVKEGKDAVKATKPLGTSDAVTEEYRDKIVALFKIRTSKKEIARQLGLSRPTVYRVLRDLGLH